MERFCKTFCKICLNERPNVVKVCCPSNSDLYRPGPDRNTACVMYLKLSCQYHSHIALFTWGSVQEDKALIKEASAESHGLKVIPVQPQQASLDLWEPICLKGDPTSKEVLLLLPEEFNFVDPEKSEKAKAEIAQVCLSSFLPTKK